MLRNDYRRALIMFRPLMRGYSGHARLERRTLMGTFCLTASAPGAASLRAALVGRKGDGYFAAPLGAMRRDSRGQYSLVAPFDPRNIEGRELEDYQLLVVVDAGAPCRLVLSGNVCGSVQMDWERVRAAACALFATGANAREGAEEAAPDEDAGRGWADTPAVEQEGTGADEADAPAAGEGREPIPDWADAPAVEQEGTGADEADAPAAGTVEADGAPEAATGDAAFADLPAVEGELDVEGPWPEPYESVRALFAGGEAMDEPPLAGYTFVRATLPDASGPDFVAVGVRAENGVPARLAYAFPGEYAPTPPAGLEDCRWFGGPRGWWVRFVPA